MVRRRRLLLLFLSPAALLVLLLAGRQLLRPPVSGWRPIFRGVDYYCEDVLGRVGDSGRAVAVRIDLDAPGLDIDLRPLDPEAVRHGAHYHLSWPDLDLASGGLDILINTAIYHPGELWRSLPGRPVRAVDMVVRNGRASHFYEHSYLLWLDGRRWPHVSPTKPPTPSQIADAVWGIGLQGVQIGDGQPRYNAISDHQRTEARAFIGFDAQARRLFLIAFENVNPIAMIDTAIRLGVRDGGMMDSGNATWLLFSPRAKGLLPFTGIRGGRPLGPWLGVRAAPLP